MEKHFFLEGTNKNLEVYDNKVIITDKYFKKGFLFWLFFVLTLPTIIGPIIIWLISKLLNSNKKSKTIGLKNIKSIELVEPSTFQVGYIQFNLDDSSNHMNDIYSENTVAFKSNKNFEICKEIQNFIELKIY